MPCRLHGTFVSSDQLAGQRTLAEPLPPQRSLLAKIQANQLANLFNIITYRPTHRDKSRTERVIERIMFGSSCLILMSGIWELGKYWWRVVDACEGRGEECNGVRRGNGTVGASSLGHLDREMIWLPVCFRFHYDLRLKSIKMARLTHANLYLSVSLSYRLLLSPS